MSERTRERDAANEDDTNAYSDTRRPGDARGTGSEGAPPAGVPGGDVEDVAIGSGDLSTFSRDKARTRREDSGTDRP